MRHQHPGNQDDVLTPEELAKFLKVSEVTTYGLIRSGEIPGHLLGREWRFVRTQVLAWLTRSAEKTALKNRLFPGQDTWYCSENGQEYVAVWVPMSREERAAQVEKAARDGVVLGQVVADYLRKWAKD